MSCKYNNCKHCGYKTECEIFKENAELKESNKMLEQGYVWHDYDAGEDCYEDSHEGKWVKRDEVYQLTKAKELLKRCYENYIYLEPLRSEIEQFINKVKK